VTLYRNGIIILVDVIIIIIIIIIPVMISLPVLFRETQSRPFAPPPVVYFCTSGQFRPKGKEVREGRKEVGW